MGESRWDVEICDFKVSIWADARVCRYNAMRVEEPVISIALSAILLEV